MQEDHMGNSKGNSSETRTLHYYDQLPRSVREELARCKFSWATRSFLKRFENGGMKAKDLVKYIRKIDDDLAAKERVKVWGPDYPRIRGTI
jgi:hypothetical protein